MKTGIIVLVLLASAASADYIISLSTIDGGGGVSSGGQYTLSGTIGQPDAGYAQGGSYEIIGGYWSGGPVCIVNLEDYAVFADFWLQSGIGLPGDLYPDGTVDTLDLEEFTSQWLYPCPYGWPLK